MKTYRGIKSLLLFIGIFLSGEICLAQTDNFVTRWNLATTGSGTTQLTFGTATSGTVNYTWQEISPGTASGSGSWSGATLTITGLPTGATIRLQITPTNFQRIIINTGADRNRLTHVEQWGTTTWTSMQRAFLNCPNLQVTATDVPDLSGVTTMSEMFRGCTTLNSPSNIGSWNTSTVTDMSSLFSLASAFNQNISTWNTGAVTNMSGLFSDASAFNQDVGNWNTGAVTNMSSMFAGAITFNQNIGAWNTAAVNNMNSMFYSAYVFNQNISGWNTAAVTNMGSMFGYAYDFNQNIGTWNTSAVTNMSRMFEDAFDFNQPIGTWNTSAVTNMSGMFIDAYAFNQNIGTWNTSAVTTMERMFDFATAFNQNIGAWNTSAVTNMSGMFADASAFNQNIGSWSLNPGVILTGMLNNCDMDCNNYSATLIGWSDSPSSPNSRTLGATGRQYGTDAVAARSNLVTNKLWTITGDSPSGTICTTVSSPTITNFTPSSGSISTTVTITGTNFSTTPADNDVQFNGISAVVSSSSATSITCTVPSGATTGPITISVGGQTATSATDFIVAGPSITITTQPLSATVCDGAIATFTTAATGTTNITYQWQIRDSDGDWINVTDVGGYSGATTSLLTINTTGVFGEGSYQCLVSGDFASDVASNEVFLEIGPNPPSVTDVVNCGPGAVTVTASGGSTGQYRWYTQSAGGTAIPGEISSTFTPPFLTSTTSYYVAINNGFCEGPRSEVQVAISTCEPQPGFVWGHGIGTGTMANGTNAGSSILIDADGNLLVCGSFQGTIDFDNGPATVNLTAGNTDAFLLKMTPTGELLWAKGIGGPGSGNDGVDGMSIDGAGNIYLLFTFNGTADFDPGTGIASLTSTPSTPANKNDIAVAKYDRDGNFIWVRPIGGNNDERSGGLKADAAGNVYITGQFRGTTSFNGSFPLTALGASSTDVLFAKMDTDGTFLWAGNIGSTLATAANLFSDGGIAIDIDGTGNVYVSGRVYGPNTTIDFDPGAGNVPQAIINDNVAFLLKLNSSGIYQNHYIVDGAAGNVVRIDASDNIYITGAFTGTVDIDPGPGVFNVTGDGANYITKLNSSGNFVWGKVLEPNGFGVSPSVLIGGIVFDAIGDLHLTGYITTTTDFDLGPLVESRGLNGLFILNPFIWKLNANGDFRWVTNMRRISGSASASINSVAISPTGEIYATGRYARTVDLDPGLCEFAVTNVNGSNIFIKKLSPTQPNVCFAQQPTSVTVCENDIAAFSVSINDGANIFYQWQKFNTVTSQFENIGDNGGFSGTDTNELNVNTAGSFGAGQYRCKVSGTSTVGEFSDAATLAFSVIAVPTTSGASGCPGTTFTLTASGGVNGEYRWYTSPTGGTPLVGETNSAYTTPVLTATTTYYVALSNGTCESTRTPVIAAIDTGCSFTITNQPGAASVCSGATASLSTSATGTTNISYQWQFSPDGLTPFTNIINGGGYADATTSTLVINTTGNFGIGKYRCYITGDSATPITTNEAELTIQATPVAPIIAGVERCGDGPVTLSALGGTSGQYRWYTASSGGTAIPGEVNNAYTTPVLAAATTFYASIVNGSCESPRSPVTATIKAIPSATATGASACPGSTLILNASGGSNGQYKWYVDATATNPIAGEVNNSYTTPMLTQTTSYFVTVTTNGCESSRTPVAATIITSGCAPEIKNASLSTVVEGTIVIDLKPLITTVGTLDVSSIKVTVPPESGAITSIENGILTITYSGVNFGGSESITIEACNTNGLCSQQNFTIEVNGDIIVYNAVSPNDDGKNEMLVLQYIDALPSTRSNRVSIYNRWGDEVFSVSDYDNNTRVFTGRNKEGNKLPSGTYYYKIYFPLQDKTLTGFLSVKY